MTAELITTVGRHRGEHRDSVRTVLAGFWALGHVVTAFLLGATALHQFDSDHLRSVQAARLAQDREPPT